MAFKINTTTVVTNTPTIDYSNIIGKPSVMAVLDALRANNQIYRDSTFLSGSTLTLL